MESPDGDLDGLIGEMRREAARRRAAPDFPVDEEALLSVELGAEAPAARAVGPDTAADLAAVIAALERSTTADPSAPTATAPTATALTATALRGLAARLAAIERRLPRAAAPGRTPGPSGAAADLTHWHPDVADHAARHPGRVLVAGPGAAAWLAALPEGGAYAVDPAAPPFSDHGPARSGDVAGHLDGLPDQALGTALVIGLVATSQTPELGRLASGLARVARSVVVVSEAPWAWRARVGPAAADTAAWRPLAAETWLELVPVPASGGRYGPAGADYLLTFG